MIAVYCIIQPIVNFAGIICADCTAGLQVRSLQMFGAPVQAAAAGDRVAMAVTQLDASQVRCTLQDSL